MTRDKFKQLNVDGLIYYLETIGEETKKILKTENINGFALPGLTKEDLKEDKISLGDALTIKDSIPPEIDIRMTLEKFEKLDVEEVTTYLEREGVKVTDKTKDILRKQNERRGLA